jgi:hypothetical protein
MRHPSLLVGTGGFEPPKSKQQIYSLSHLATLVYPHFKIRAEEGTRTPDLLITNQWLYQLSYFGLFLFDFKERPLIFGIANLVTFFVVAKKNKTFFAFFQKQPLFKKTNYYFAKQPVASITLISREIKA